MLTVSQVHVLLNHLGRFSAEYRAGIFASFADLPQNAQMLRTIVYCGDIHGVSANTVDGITDSIRHSLAAVPLGHPLLSARLAQGFKSSMVKDIMNNNELGCFEFVKQTVDQMSRELGGRAPNFFIPELDVD